MKFKALFRVIPLVVYMVSLAINATIYASVINMLYPLSIFVLAYFLLSRSLKHSKSYIFLASVVLLQIILVYFILPKHTYSEAVNKFKMDASVDEVVNLPPASVLSSDNAFTIINRGYKINVIIDGEDKTIIVNPNNINQYGVLERKR